MDAAGINKEKIIEAIGSAKSSIESGEVAHINIANIEGEKKTPIETSNFLNLLGTSVPSSLLRSFDKDFMFGMHGVENNPVFILISLDSFDIAFAGMLEWEKTMLKDLNFIISSPNDAGIATTTTATTNLWSDLIVQNKDTRVLRDNFGSTIILYSFLDNQTLVITTKENTFREILNRFMTSKLIR